MYEVSSPPALGKRRSWTGRLRDRLKASRGPGVVDVDPPHPLRHPALPNAIRTGNSCSFTISCGIGYYELSVIQ